MAFFFPNSFSPTCLDFHWKRHEIDSNDVNFHGNIPTILHFARAIRGEGDTTDLKYTVAIWFVLVFDTLNFQIRTRDLQLCKLSRTEQGGWVVLGVREPEFEFQSRFAESELRCLGLWRLGECEEGSDIGWGKERKHKNGRSFCCWWCIKFKVRLVSDLSNPQG